MRPQWPNRPDYATTVTDRFSIGPLVPVYSVNFTLVLRLKVVDEVCQANARQFKIQTLNFINEVLAPHLDTDKLETEII